MLDVGYGSHIGEKAAAVGVPVFNFPPARDSYPLCFKWRKLHWDWEIYTMMGGFIQFSFTNARVKLVKPPCPGVAPAQIGIRVVNLVSSTGQFF